jgi:hypothetical protein
MASFNPADHMVEEDASDLQFPKGNFDKTEIDSFFRGSQSSIIITP